jgi:predicted esterase YcpF (UPF0227 family)
MNSDKLKTYIVIKGGLGNQIFQIATGLKYCLDNNRELIITLSLITPNTHQTYEETIVKLKTLFPNVKIIQENINKINKVIYNEANNDAFTYNKILVPSTNIILNGYFQNMNYLDKNTLINNIKVNPNLNLNKNLLNKDFSNYYFIHIRLGDYVNHPFHYINLDEYYNYCINQIRSKDKFAKFIILTNQYDKILQDKLNKIKLNHSDYIVQDKSDDDVNTLYIMMSCKGAICANSSLSWIGSYLQKDDLNIYMPYPWVNLNTEFTHDKIIEIYPKYVKLYNTITNKEIIR